MLLKQPLEKRINNQLKEMYFVGKLATDQDMIDLNPQPVEDNGNFFAFYINCLSEIPEEITNSFSFHNKLIRGTTYTSPNYGYFKNIIENKDLVSHEKERAIKEFAKGKLFLFKMNTNGVNINADIIEIKTVSSYANEYILIPSPCLEKGENHRSYFENKISRTLQYFNLDNYPRILDNPDLIYFDGRLYSNLSLESPYYATNYCQKTPNEAKFIEATDMNFLDNVIFEVNKSLYVVTDNYTLRVFDYFYKNEKLVEFHDFEITNEEEGLSEINEYEFLEQLKLNALLKRLFYKEEDLYNFHICMKTNLLTIIGGMSGIGKSQLALLYGKTLGLDKESDILFLPISPSYTEPNDLLGFLNPSTGIYNESETGLVSLLDKASLDENKNRLFMVIFDEMNLAQVEHWFSPFISLLELDEEQRYLHLFNENNHCVNNYSSKIHIGSNILFVGTVNFDETTKLFSDRLLDRANVFIPGKPSLNEMYMSCYNESVDDLEFEPVIIHSRKYRNWTNMSSPAAEKYKLSEDEIKILDKLHTLIHQQDRQKGISFRTAKNIAYYLNNIPSDAEGQPYISREKAFDIQLKQRVITKIRGIDVFVLPLLGTYKGDDFEPGSLTSYLLGFMSEDQPDKLRFEQSIESIKSKVKEIMYYGFTY